MSIEKEKMEANDKEKTLAEIEEENIEKEQNEKIDSRVYGNTHVQQYKTDVAFKTLVEGVEEGLYVIPDFQRLYKWKKEQVQELAISLIRGLPIPPIYAYRNGSGQLEILDGQQRVVSMYLYYKGIYIKGSYKNFMDLRGNDEEISFEEKLESAYELEKVDYVMTYYDSAQGVEEGKDIPIGYEKLPKDVRRKLDYTNITVVEISVENHELRNRYLYKIFANLNAGGIPLTNQELRNGIYRCPFYEMLFDIQNNNKKWKELSGNDKVYDRNTLRLLRLCAFRYYVSLDNDIFRIEKYENINKMLNDFSEEAMKFKPEKINEYRTSLEEFFKQCEGKMPREMSIFENIYTVVDKTKMKIKVTRELCNAIMSTKEYESTIRTGNATKTSIETKLKVVYDELRK